MLVPHPTFKLLAMGSRTRQHPTKGEFDLQTSHSPTQANPTPYNEMSKFPSPDPELDLESGLDSLKPRTGLRTSHQICPAIKQNLRNPRQKYDLVEWNPPGSGQKEIPSGVYSPIAAAVEFVLSFSGRCGFGYFWTLWEVLLILFEYNFGARLRYRFWCEVGR